MKVDLLSLFLEEAEEQLELLEHLLLKLEEKEDPEIIDGIFRVAHTIKGSAACVGFREVSDFAHELENLLDKLRKGEISLSPKVCNLMLKGRDALRLLVRGAKDGGSEAAFAAARSLAEEVAGFLAGGGAEEGRRRFFVRAHLDPEFPMKEARAFVILKRLEELGSLEASLPRIEDLLGGRVVPKDVQALVCTEVGEGDLEECLRSYEEVVALEVRPSLDFGAPSWEKFWQCVEEHCHGGKKVAVKVDPHCVALDLEALRVMTEAARRGCIFYTTDPFYHSILSRFVFR
ncbi:Hpt domain-containing protein [Desulfovirgula thermocuniculi]|uniref:Hpt domain-containing protein n=1 Tax=Desulfovirgula thermocuniculi TaxID=348842 RepID=UPI00041360E5|nr:Hpt domain-containing protein [Desulfovirgula thermocuniculi]